MALQPRVAGRPRSCGWPVARWGCLAVQRSLRSGGFPVGNEALPQPPGDSEPWRSIRNGRGGGAVTFTSPRWSRRLSLLTGQEFIHPGLIVGVQIAWHHVMHESQTGISEWI